MPSGNKKNKKKSNRPTRPTQSNADRSPDSLEADIDHAFEWNVVANILCDTFELPDLSTRNGLKKVHSNFDAIFQRLDSACTNYGSNLKVVGGIVAIWAKMCNDALLRDKLLKKGILSRIIPLLDDPNTVQLALRSLASMTHLGGIPAKAMIAKESPKIIKVLQDNPDDFKIAELAITTLSHSVPAVVDVEHRDARAVKQLDLPNMLRVIAEVAKRPSATPYLITHAHDLVINMSLFFSKIVRDSPCMSFLVAFLRSESIGFRCSALRGVLRLVSQESVFDMAALDPRRMIEACGKRWPDEVVDAIMDYGMGRSDCFMTLHATRDYQKAMMSVLEDKNIYQLGKKLAELILRTEFAIVEGRFEAEGPGGTRDNYDFGLPFKMWTDALPHCAKAIREKGKAEEQDLADVLDCKYQIKNGNHARAIALAKKAIDRSPDFAYFYYIISLGVDRKEGLRYAKQGAKCKTGMTPFIKHALLHRGVEHGADLATQALMDSHPGEQRWKDGIGFLRSAYEDARDYIASAPPDQRQMKTVIQWYIGLVTVVRGPALDADLASLKSYRDKLAVAEACSKHLSLPILNTQPKMMAQVILDHYATAAREWGAVVKLYDERELAPTVDVDAPEAVDELTRWLEDVELDGDGKTRSPEHADVAENVSHPRLGGHSVQLYRCANCGNPSAVLRKCSRCGNVRYCDSECQKAHWSEHKSICKKT